jgi:hypothetical protein
VSCAAAGALEIVFMISSIEGVRCDIGSGRKADRICGMVVA